MELQRREVKPPTLHLNDGSSCDVTRPSPEASWRGPASCPVCGLTPIRVRAYHDDPPGPDKLGFLTAVAWCAGRHEEPVGYLRERVVPGVLVPMGVGKPETFRPRIY